jgi:hypothetical protein
VLSLVDGHIHVGHHAEGVRSERDADDEVALDRRQADAAEKTDDDHGGREQQQDEEQRVRHRRASRSSQRYHAPRRDRTGPAPV